MGLMIDDVFNCLDAICDTFSEPLALNDHGLSNAESNAKENKHFTGKRRRVSKQALVSSNYSTASPTLSDSEQSDISVSFSRGEFSRRTLRLIKEFIACLLGEIVRVYNEPLDRSQYERFYFLSKFAEQTFATPVSIWNIGIELAHSILQNVCYMHWSRIDSTTMSEIEHQLILLLKAKSDYPKAQSRTLRMIEDLVDSASKILPWPIYGLPVRTRIYSGFPTMPSVSGSHVSESECRYRNGRSRKRHLSNASISGLWPPTLTSSSQPPKANLTPAVPSVPDESNVVGSFGPTWSAACQLRYLVEEMPPSSIKKTEVTSSLDPCPDFKNKNSYQHRLRKSHCIPTISRSPSPSFDTEPSPPSPVSSLDSASTQLNSLQSHKITLIDPILSKLENESRLRSQAECAVCKKMGWDFPRCPRCSIAWCSRSCRVGHSSNGKHVCHIRTSTV